MQVHLPNSAFIGNIDPFIASIRTNSENKLIVTGHERWISVHPVALCMVAAMGLLIPSQSIQFKKLEAVSKHYLERIGLFKMLSVSSGITIKEHESAGRFIPLTQIKTSDELTVFLKEVTPLLHLGPNEASSIRYVISELVRNVLEHARSKMGAIVCAQYYEKSNMIRLGIADTGVGVLESIKQSHRASNDLEAIRLALIPGITGTTMREGGTDRNAGAGLFFIKSIATVNRNFFMIYSGSALYKLLKRKNKIKLHIDPYKDRCSITEDLPYWRGTVVGIDISLGESHEFSLFLDLIRETYREAIRERRKARYQKPKFT